MPDEWPLYSHLGPLGALPTAPRLARQYTRLVLAQWGMSELSEYAELIASELTTNAVAASSSPDGQPLYQSGRLAVIHLGLLSDRAQFLMEVWDSIPEVLGTPVSKETSEYDESGRGLSIVGSLSERWGWKPVPGWPGKMTWALLRVQQLRHKHQKLWGAGPPNR